MLLSWALCAAVVPVVATAVLCCLLFLCAAVVGAVQVPHTIAPPIAALLTAYASPSISSVKHPISCTSSSAPAWSKLPTLCKIWAFSYAKYSLLPNTHIVAAVFCFWASNYDIELTLVAWKVFPVLVTFGRQILLICRTLLGYVRPLLHWSDAGTCTSCYTWDWGIFSYFYRFLYETFTGCFVPLLEIGTIGQNYLQFF